MKKTFIITLSVILIWLTVLYLLVTAQFEYSPLNVSKTLTLEQMILVPQGWGFFTRNPREDRIKIYKYHNSGYAEILDKNFSTQNYFGISRKNRITLNEVLYNLKIVGDSSWYQTRIVNDSLVKSLPEVTIVNLAKDPLNCGKLLVIKEKTIPWAWRKHKGSLNPMKSLVKINLICK